MAYLFDPNNDAGGFKVNFATGEVTVNPVYVSENNSTSQTRYLDDIFGYGDNMSDEEKAGWTKTKASGDHYIFANNTYHTLNFFYLERGAGASNLELSYNLTEFPSTAITKVDQYDNPIQGAKFAVYAADDEYNYLADKGSDVSYTAAQLTNCDYDSSGNIVDSDGKTVVKALYTGTTDENGNMVFVDNNGMYYSLGDASTHAVLVGHRGLPSAKLFTNLDKLAVGDSFSVTALGEQMWYEVDQILIVEPTDVFALGIEEGAGLLHASYLHALRREHAPPAGAGA